MNEKEALAALNDLYNASRLAPLTAADHEHLRKLAERLMEHLKPAEPSHE
jgi:hypothetical protein